MAQHVNFYENVKEADMRLRGTVVLYDGEPVYVHHVSDHKADGIIRLYCEPIGNRGGLVSNRYNNWPINQYGSHGYNGKSTGELIDDWMDNNKNSPVMRKMMNSPSFNKFRPFPLGMMNSGNFAYYLERQPTRNTYQGLTSNMIQSQTVDFSNTLPPRSSVGIDPTSSCVRDCIVGDYPSIHDVLKNLKDPDISNVSVAFSRCFAIMRGPIDMLYLAYKSDVVGILPKSDISCVRLGKKFGHTKEVVAELNIFNTIEL